MPPSRRKKRSKTKVLTASIFADINKLVDDGEETTKAIARVASDRKLAVDAVRSRYYRFKAKVEAENGDGSPLHGNTLLSRKQEDALVATILWKNAQSKPFTIPHFLSFVGQLYFDGQEPSRSWLSRFLEDHSDFICIKRSQYLSASRANEENPSKVRAFIDFQNEFRTVHHLTAKNIVNVDETRILLRDLQHGGFVLTNRLAKEAQRQGKRIKAFCSYVPFTAADGSVIVQFFVLPTPENATSVNVPHLTRKRNPKMPPTYYLFSSNGYTTKESFPPMVEIFLKHWNQLRPGLDVHLYMDRLGSHIKPLFQLNLSARGVHCVLFPSGTTHFLQPLDDVAFALLKHLLQYYHGIEVKYTDWNSGRSDSPLLLAAVVAVSEAMKPGPIRKSFAQTGIWPWNPELIMERVAHLYPESSTSSPNLTPTTNEIRTALHKSSGTPLPAAITKINGFKYREDRAFTLDDLRRLNDEKEAKKAQEHLDKELRKEERKRKQEANKEKQAKRQKVRESEKKAREEARLERDRQKKKQIASTTCRGCDHRWRSAKDWKWCDHCDYYALCPTCWVDPPSKQEMAKHEETPHTPHFIEATVAAVAS